jgi:hypothetical protein
VAGLPQIKYIRKIKTLAIITSHTVLLQSSKQLIFRESHSRRKCVQLLFELLDDHGGVQNVKSCRTFIGAPKYDSREIQCSDF